MFKAIIHVCHITGWPTGDEVPVAGTFEASATARAMAEELADRLRRQSRYQGMCLVPSVDPVAEPATAVAAAVEKCVACGMWECAHQTLAPREARAPMVCGNPSCYGDYHGPMCSEHR